MRMKEKLENSFDPLAGDEVLCCEVRCKLV